MNDVESKSVPLTILKVEGAYVYDERFRKQWHDIEDKRWKITKLFRKIKNNFRDKYITY